MEEEIKDQVLQILVTKDERELIEEISKKDNRSVSQFCRLIIMENIKKENEKYKS